jgi:hypothetical protein
VTANGREMLSEVAEAFRMAAKLREEAEAGLFVKSERSGRSYIHPGVAAADVEVRRAALLLSRLAAMAKAVKGEDEPAEHLEGLALLEANTQFDADPAVDARIRRERLESQERAALPKGRKRAVRRV